MYFPKNACVSMPPAPLRGAWRGGAYTMREVKTQDESLSIGLYARACNRASVFNDAFRISYASCFLCGPMNWIAMNKVNFIHRKLRNEPVCACIPDTICRPVVYSDTLFIVCFPELALHQILCGLIHCEPVCHGIYTMSTTSLSL